jgi:succinyl-diaminopimelate desuccinylase
MRLDADHLLSADRQRHDEAVAFVQDLVRIPSVNGRDTEAAVARRVVNEAERLNLPARLVGADSGRPNVLVELGAGERGFALVAHLDTVDEGEEDDWTYPPFGGEIHDDFLYGRGAADNKAGLACGLYGLAFLRDHALLDPSATRVVLAGVVDEESGACSPLGVRHLLDRGLLDVGGAIYTYTSRKIRIGHRGVLRLVLRATGAAVHSGRRVWHQRREGAHAGMALVDIARALEGLEIAAPEHLAFPGLGCTVTVTGLHFGPEARAGGVVPGRAEAGVDIRLMPGQSREGVLDRVAEVVEANTLEGVEVDTEVVVDIPAAVIPADHRLVQVAQRWTKAITGETWPVEGAGPANEGWMLIQAGIPTLCGFGPQGGNAHAADEYVEVGSLSQAVGLYAGVIGEYLG